MNTKLLLSKKFRASVMAALTSLLTFGVSKWGWDLDVEELTLLVSCITIPFLMYIGAEGYSEAGAKKVIEESKAKTEIAEMVMADILQKNKVEE